MSIVLTATVKGLAQLRKQIDKASDGYRDSMAAAIYQKGLQIMADSKKECPVDFGFLRGSGYVAPPKPGREPVVELGYGKNYGPYVHERRELNHPTGKSHFLSDPLNRHKSGYTRWIQGKVRENYRRGLRIGRVPRSQPARPSDTRREK